MVYNVLFEPTAHDLKKGLKTIDFLFKLAAIADAKAGLLAFFVDAYSIVACTPATGRFDTVAFDFSRLAELAAIVAEWLVNGYSDPL